MPSLLLTNIMEQIKNLNTDASSPLLTDIMEQIENLDTDAFGKFYLCGALLNAIHETSTTPDGNQTSFIDHLPKYAFLMLPDVPLNIGRPSPHLVPHVAQYSREIKQQPHLLSSELLYILDKMLVHLRAITPQSTKKNNAVYVPTTFQDCQQNIEDHLISAVKLNHARHTLLHKLIGTALVVLMVMQCSYYAPLLLGAAISLFAVILAFGFLQYTKKELNFAQENYARSKRVLLNEKKNFVLKDMYDNFFISSFVTPLQQTTERIKAVMPISEDKIPDVPCFQR